MELPTLSVILPNYNHSQYLPECLKAILDQSEKAKEVIVIDDASTDNSVEIIKSFAEKDASIKLISNENNLGNILTNLKGLEHATGDYVLLAAVDDYLLPGFFESSLKLLAKHPQAGLCSALSQRVNENGDYLDTVPKPPYLSNHSTYIPPERIQHIVKFDKTLPVMPSVALFNRKLAIEIKAFSTDSGRYIDGFAVMLMALNHGVCFIPQEYGVYRVLPESGGAKSRQEPKAHLQDVTPMWKLMETTYANRFPYEIRQSIKKGHLYTYGAMALNQLNESQEKFFKDMQVSLENPSWIDRLFLSGTQWLDKFQFLITKGFLYLRLRGISFNALIRIKDKYKNRTIS